MGEQGEKPLFAAEVKGEPCSWNECLAGHRWPPTLVVGQCPGCKGPVVAFRQENCPFCNEPTVGVMVRTDLVPTGGGVVPRCQGAKPMGESVDVRFQREAWKQGQLTFKPMGTQEMEKK